MGRQLLHPFTEDVIAHVRAALVADIYALAGKLREADKAEVRALTGHTPEQALTISFDNSEAPHSIIDDHDAVVGMFGVAPSTDLLAGLVWMLGSDGLTAIGREFLRQSRYWVHALHLNYPVLTNVTDERNKLHHRWLKWCGFTFIHRHPALGVEGRPFLEFVRIKKCASRLRLH